MSARWVGVAAFLVAVGIGGTAWAQDAREEARRRMEAGTSYYDEGRFALALTEFTAVHDLMLQVNPDRAGVVWYNVARCYSRMGRDREAIATYERFLRETEQLSDRPMRSEAEAELRELRTRASLPGGQSEGVSISPVGPIVIGVGGAAFIASIVTGVLAMSADDAADIGCIDGRCPPENLAIANEAQIFANTTDALLVFGGLLAATGIVLTLVLPGEDGAAPIGAACTGEGCALFAHGRF